MPGLLLVPSTTKPPPFGGGSFQWVPAASNGPSRLQSAGLMGCGGAVPPPYSPMEPAVLLSNWYGGIPMCAGGGCERGSPLWQKKGKAAPGCPVGARPILLAWKQKSQRQINSKTRPDKKRISGGVTATGMNKQKGYTGNGAGAVVAAELKRVNKSKECLFINAPVPYLDSNDAKIRGILKRCNKLLIQYAI